MPAGEQLLDDLAAAVLDGASPDWVAAESSAADDVRPIVGALRLVASVAQVHRNLSTVHDGISPEESLETSSAESWGHLRLLDRIGRGAFGEVFRAWDTRLDREVALKLLPAASSLDPDAEGSIIREGRLLAKVRHPNVVTIYGAEQIGNRIGLWMELVHGQTLEQMVRQGKVLRDAEIVEVGLQLCRAVSAVHAAGLLHRDIKAHNVIRADDGRIVLMDFGTGRELGADSSSDLAGTPLYLAPEVLAARPATAQSDIYSLGVLLYHLATGSYPVAGRTVAEVRQGHDRGKRIDIRTRRPRLGKTLSRIIERSIAAEPERRFTSIDALARDLTALQRRPRIALRYGLAAAAAVLLGALLVIKDTGTVQDPAIVVLPFKGDSDSQALLDSITDGLIRQLSIIDGLTVKSQTTSFMLRDKPITLSDIGKRLNVNLLVQGDGQLSGGSLVIRAALVSAGDGRHLWSDEIKRSIGSEGDVVATVEDLTRTIVNQLRLKIGRTQRRYQTALATYTTFEKARKLQEGRRERGVAAVPLFEEVIHADPSYAPALAALAATYGHMAVNYPVAGVDVRGADESRFPGSLPPGEAAARALSLTQRALQEDPLLAEAHAAQGFLHALALRWTEADKAFKRAIELEPSLTLLYTDYVHSTLLPWGRLNHALSIMETAVDLDPGSLDARRMLAEVQLRTGRYADALENCSRVLELDPTFPLADIVCTWALFFKGERAEALERLEKWSAPRPGVIRPGVKGYIHAINGERAEAEAIAAQFEHLPQRQAEIYGLLGDTDRVFEALERLAIINPNRAAYELSRPQLGLQGHQRLEEFRRKLRIPQP